MELCNAVIRIKPERLNHPLVPWYAGQLSAFHFALRDAPSDITGAEIHVGVPNDTTHFVVPCVLHANGEWTGYASPGVFPDAGQTKYEVVAFDAAGHEVWLGEGQVLIKPRVSGNEVVATATDENGGTHKLVAIYIDGEWTLRVQE